MLLLASMELNTSTPGLCCVCAEAGASDLHQAHLLPVSAAAAKPALTAQRPYHVVDSHSACHLGCWRRGCSAGGCYCYTCFGQSCRSSNSHSEHCGTARYAAQCKPMCVSVSDKLLGSLEGGNSSVEAKILLENLLATACVVYHGNSALTSQLSVLLYCPEIYKLFSLVFSLVLGQVNLA